MAFQHKRERSKSFGNPDLSNFQSEASDSSNRHASSFPNGTFDELLHLLHKEHRALQRENESLKLCIRGGGHEVPAVSPQFQNGDLPPHKLGQRTLREVSDAGVQQQVEWTSEREDWKDYQLDKVEWTSERADWKDYQLDKANFRKSQMALAVSQTNVMDAASVIKTPNSSPRTPRPQKCVDLAMQKENPDVPCYMSEDTSSVQPVASVFGRAEENGHSSICIKKRHTNGLIVSAGHQQDEAMQEGVPTAMECQAKRDSFSQSCNSFPSVEDVVNSVRYPSRRRLWVTLNDASSSTVAKYYHYLMPAINIASACLSVPQTGDIERPIDGSPLVTIEYVFEVIYVFDLMARLCTCPDRSAYFRSWFNIFDILGILTIPIRIQYRFAQALSVQSSELVVQEYVLFCIVPIIRLLKTLRHFELLLLLLGAFREASRALPVLLFVWFLFTLVFAVLVYGVEDRSDVHSLPHAMWFVIVTASTVGYGDMVPKTVAGSLIIAVTIISGVLYMAVPIGLISQIFANIWNDRDRILFLKRLHTCLEHCDLGPRNVEALFAAFDGDGSGFIDGTEWRAMLKSIGMDVHGGGRTAGFRYFCDGDTDNGVSPKRFVRVLWPDLYSEVFRKARIMVENSPDENEHEEGENLKLSDGESSDDSSIIYVSPRPSRRHSVVPRNTV